MADYRYRLSPSNPVVLPDISDRCGVSKSSGGAPWVNSLILQYFHTGFACYFFGKKLSTSRILSRSKTEIEFKLKNCVTDSESESHRDCQWQPELPVLIRKRDTNLYSIFHMCSLYVVVASQYSVLASSAVIFKIKLVAILNHVIMFLTRFLILISFS